MHTYVWYPELEMTLPSSRVSCIYPSMLIDTITDGIGRLTTKTIECSFGNINGALQRNHSALFLLGNSSISYKPLMKAKDGKGAPKNDLQYLGCYDVCLKIVTAELKQLSDKVDGVKM